MPTPAGLSTPGSMRCINIKTSGTGVGTDGDFPVEIQVDTPRESQAEFRRKTFESAAKNQYIKAPRQWIWDKDEDNLHKAWRGNDGRFYER